VLAQECFSRTQPSEPKGKRQILCCRKLLTIWSSNLFLLGLDFRFWPDSQLHLCLFFARAGPARPPRRASGFSAVETAYRGPRTSPTAINTFYAKRSGERAATISVVIITCHLHCQCRVVDDRAERRHPNSVCRKSHRLRVIRGVHNSP